MIIKLQAKETILRHETLIVAQDENSKVCHAHEYGIEPRRGYEHRLSNVD